MVRALAISLCVIALLAQGCGWQLRGYEQYKAGNVKKINEINLRTTATSNRLFQASLKRQLEDLSIALNKESDTVLTLHKENTENRPLSYGSTGIPVQYQLIMSIRYELSITPSQPATQRTITARRQYDFDTSLVLAKKEEEKKLRQEMREELAARIIASIHE
ncbi:MAG: hypothetical protein K6L80_09660 [Agarilytica sp.]